MVVGGSGFLGDHIIQALQKAGMTDVTCGDLVKDNTSNCNFIKLDILDEHGISNLKNYDTVINCTGQVTQPFNHCFQLNSIGVTNLAKALSGRNTRLIHISTVAVYGSAESCNEENPLNPETNYATAKAFAEQTLLEYYDRDSLTILRLSNLYGTCQLKGIFAYLLRSYNSNLNLNFNNDGNLTRSFMHVEDCADLIVEVVKKSGFVGIYNVKGHETYSIKELIKKFETHFDVQFETNFNQASPWENIKALDDSKLRGLVNLTPRWMLFDFIEQELEKYSHEQ